MAYNFKQEMNKPERLAGGHRLCAGCGAGIAVRGVMRALKPEDKAVVCSATARYMRWEKIAAAISAIPKRELKIVPIACGPTAGKITNLSPKLLAR